MKKILNCILLLVILSNILCISYAKTYFYELPIENSTGYTTIKTKIYSNSNLKEIIKEIDGGIPFTILEESGECWKIQCVDGIIGWIEYKYCMINLPDIIPSIIYKNTNGESSIYRSRGYDLPNVTGTIMYDSYHYNEKLQKFEYVVPCLYSMAKKIYRIQRNALENGETLILYEAYRPYSTQMSVVNALTSILDNPNIYDGITGDGWSISWFIATGYSNHQLGYAIDTSLGKIIKSKITNIGCNYTYKEIIEYDEYIMQTPMHELSRDSISLEKPINSLDKYAWENINLASSMNDFAIKLRNYCTGNGLTPLASEWWHFNDLDARENIYGNYGKADWEASTCVSKALKYSEYEWINKIGETLSISKQKYKTLFGNILKF